MANYKSVRPGLFFCIPLFMDRTDWKLKQKLRDADMNKSFAFGRVIESNSSVLVEIFRKIGPADTNLLEVVKSGVLFSPIQVFWDAVIKGRWRVIGSTTDYDKNTHSKYHNLKMVFGDGVDFRLRNLSSGTEKTISREEASQYEFSTVWFPIDLENRIALKLGV